MLMIVSEEMVLIKAAWSNYLLNHNITDWETRDLISTHSSVLHKKQL